MRIRGWLTGLMVFLLAPCLLFASLWFKNKFENVEAIDQSLRGLHLIQALGPLVQEKSVTGALGKVPPNLRQELIDFGGENLADPLTSQLDIFLNEPDVKTSLGYAQELSVSISRVAMLDMSVSYEASTLPNLVNNLLFSVIIESSKMTDDARRLFTRKKVNVWEKMLITVQGGKFKAAADTASQITANFIDKLEGPGSAALQSKTQLFRQANFAFQSEGSKLLRSTILAKTGKDVAAGPIAEVHPELMLATLALWQSSLDYLNGDLVKRRTEMQLDVLLAGLIGALVIVAAFAISVALTRALAERTQQEIESLGYHDPLTGLPNRRALLKRIKTLPEPAPNARYGLLLLDLRQFKKVNDRFSDQCGDSILRSVAGQLGEIADPEDFLSRTGGTEFLLFRPELTDAGKFKEFAEELIQEIRKERFVADQKVKIEANVGLLISRRGDCLTSHTLTDAALALRSAKQKGYSTFDLFTPEMRAAFEEHGEIAKELLKAIEEGVILPWYQPQIDIHTGEIVGAEALVRWIDHDEVRYPGSFLPAAVEAGYMELIETTVRANALRLADNLSGRTQRNFHLGLNVSASLLASAEAVDALYKQVRDMGLEPATVSLEILEAVMIDEITAAPIKENIARLSDLGFHIELDDFGTGHSSISSLRDLKVDRVKIDRSFISGVDHKPALQKFTSALINLAKSLDISVLAEGVETEAERQWLLENGCDVIQGFLISKAVPEDELATLILKQNFSVKAQLPDQKSIRSVRSR